MKQIKTNRRNFIYRASSFITSIISCRLFANTPACAPRPSLDVRQREIDKVTPQDFIEYLKKGNIKKFAAFDYLEIAFDKVFNEIKTTSVTDINKPAIWYLYNMGIIVKTTNQLFAIDLHHRCAGHFADALDFMLITHAHGDHWRNNLYTKMDKSGKTVVSNFLKNTGAKNCGYTPEKKKTLQFGDVTVISGRCDHNAKLIDYTTPYEIHIGSYTIYHTGDCCRMNKLHVARQPDLWIVHPYCGLNVEQASQKKINPKKVVIAHLQELGHARNRWRWTYNDGQKKLNSLKKIGFDAIMPLWGERLA